MKTKLILTILSIIISFTPLRPDHILNTVKSARPVKPVVLAAVREQPTLLISAPQPQFNPNNPATWPTCPAGDIVWASNGTCHPPATSVTPSTPVYAVGACSAYLPLIEQYNWPVSTMYAIMQAESSCSPYAYNPSGCYGLFQLYGQDITDPAANIAAAYQIYLSQGLSAWSSWSSGAYLQYLN